MIDHGVWMEGSTLKPWVQVWTDHTCSTVRLRDDWSRLNVSCSHFCTATESWNGSFRFSESELIVLVIHFGRAASISIMACGREDSILQAVHAPIVHAESNILTCSLPVQPWGSCCVNAVIWSCAVQQIYLCTTHFCLRNKFLQTLQISLDVTNFSTRNKFLQTLQISLNVTNFSIHNISLYATNFSRTLQISQNVTNFSTRKKFLYTSSVMPFSRLSWPESRRYAECLRNISAVWMSLVGHIYAIYRAILYISCI